MIKNRLKYSALLLAIIVFVAGSTAAQEPIFAYVQKVDGIAASGNVAASKFATANKVFDALVLARGDFRLNVPEFAMNNGERFVAWMDPINTVIGIEEKAFDTCMEMGADSLNALAALLSHELTHYYEQHDWGRSFAKSNVDLAAAGEIGNLEEGIKQEAQADYLGGFLALTAGYNMYDINARLLPKLYEAYGLKEKLASYPSLSDRIAMTQHAANQLKDLQIVYEMAQYLSLLEDYSMAATYYRHIAQDYPGREILNNAGVNHALAALGLFTTKEMPYVFPLEPDPDSRLYALKGAEQDKIQKRNKLLKEAIQDLERALKFDPDYAPAYLNKACCYALQQSWDRADFWLSEYKKMPKANIAAGLNLEAIIAALQQETGEAEKLFKSAKENGDPLAAINLAVLMDENRVPSPKKGFPALEQINDLTLEDYMLAPEVDKEVKPIPGVTCGSKQYPGSKIMIHCADNAAFYAVIQLCEQGCDDSTQKGIKIGSTREQVMEQYGPPIRQVAWKGGLAWTYPNLSLLFEFNNAGVVQGWGCFQQLVD